MASFNCEITPIIVSYLGNAGQSPALTETPFATSATRSGNLSKRPEHFLEPGVTEHR
ncbi:hypothetical protein [Rhizobium sp. BK376]|uniref:hypothetical protein n=1 Tax=Rhizobium sp. BK376 TaxID=2512149 RepID=UPI0014054397|nr:hypothetical protein [Rhizobium sp. BK376]